MVVRLYGTLLLSAKRPRPPGRWKNAIRKTIWITTFGALIEYHLASSKDQARIHQFGKKVLSGIFLGYELIARRLGKEILVADLEDLEKLDAGQNTGRNLATRKMRSQRRVRNDKKICSVSQRRTKPLSIRFQKFGHYQRHFRRNPRKENLWWISGASMHMLSKKDMNSAELETLRVSRNPKTVTTTEKELQTNEEEQSRPIVFQILEVTPAVLSLGKFCEDHGYSYDWTSGQQPHLIQNGGTCNVKRRITCRSLFWDCQPALPDRQQENLQHRQRKTQQWKTLRQVQQIYEVEVHAVEHWETSCTTPKKQRTK